MAGWVPRAAEFGAALGDRGGYFTFMRTVTVSEAELWLRSPAAVTFTFSLSVDPLRYLPRAMVMVPLLDEIVSFFEEPFETFP